MEQHYLNNDEFNRLCQWANSIRGFYGFPVYLVGSVLTKKDYRDIDVICIISDVDFRLRYGDVKIWGGEMESGLWTDISWKWSDDCIKKWRQGCKYTDLNLDFKVYPQTYQEYEFGHLPKLKLDSHI
jgi:predicted nucleotidyltransferase